MGLFGDDVDGPAASSSATGPVTVFGGRPRSRLAPSLAVVVFDAVFFNDEPPALGGRSRPLFFGGGDDEALVPGFGDLGGLAAA